MFWIFARVTRAADVEGLAVPLCFLLFFLPSMTLCILRIYICVAAFLTRNAFFLSIPLQGAAPPRPQTTTTGAGFLQPKRQVKRYDALYSIKNNQMDFDNRLCMLRSSNDDIITSMMDKLRTGPSSLLYKIVRSGLPVRVVTRHKRGVRGEAIGKLTAFDKHFNLVLRDVKETYYVRILKERVKADGKIIRRPILERRQRTLSNVLLTGQNVVLISTPERDDKFGSVTFV